MSQSEAAVFQIIKELCERIVPRERNAFRQQAAFAVPCGADSLRLLRETRFVFHGIIPLFCFSLVPAKLLLLRHASAGAASRCVTTRALLIVAGMTFSPLCTILLMHFCFKPKKIKACKIVVFYKCDADAARYSSATACTSSTE